MLNVTNRLKQELDVALRKAGDEEDVLDPAKVSLGFVTMKNIKVESRAHQDQVLMGSW